MMHGQNHIKFQYAVFINEVFFSKCKNSRYLRRICN